MKQTTKLGLIKNFRECGIPTEEVGSRLLEFANDIEKHDMALGADTTCNISFMRGNTNIVQSATITVYFFERDNNLEGENGNADN